MHFAKYLVHRLLHSTRFAKCVAPLPKALGVLHNALCRSLNVLCLALTVSCAVLCPCALSFLLRLPCILQKCLVCSGFCCLHPAFQEMHFLASTVPVTECAGRFTEPCVVHVPDCTVRFAECFTPLNAPVATVRTVQQAFS